MWKMSKCIQDFGVFHRRAKSPFVDGGRGICQSPHKERQGVDWLKLETFPSIKIIPGQCAFQNHTIINGFGLPDPVG
jgi:hypothetical protein